MNWFRSGSIQDKQETQNTKNENENKENSLQENQYENEYQVENESDIKKLEKLFTNTSDLFNKESYKNKSIIVKNIEKMVTMIIQADKKKIDIFFDFFCEQNIFEFLYNMLQKSYYREIKLQCLQQICMLLCNIKSDIFISYLLSNYIINKIVHLELDFKDDEIVDFYISFLKNLSQRLQSQPLPLFFNAKYSNFPIVWQSIRFYNHPDGMVKTTVRNIVLGIMKIEDKKVNQYFQSFPFITFYENIVCQQYDLWLKIQEYLNKNKNNQKIQQIKDQLFEDTNSFCFIQDLFKVSSLIQQEIITNSIFNFSIFPLLNELQKTPNSYQKLQVPFILHQLIAIYQNIDNQDILEMLTTTLFQEKLNKQYLDLILKEVVYPKSYNKIWQFKGFWDYYPEFVKEQSFELFKQSQNPIGPKYNIQKIEQNKINNQEDEEEKIQETIQNPKLQQKQPEIQSEEEQKIDKNEEEQQSNLIEQLVKEEIKEISNIQNYKNEKNKFNNNKNQNLVFQDQDQIQQNIQIDQQNNFKNNYGSDQEIPEEEQQQQFEQNQNQLDRSQEFQMSEKSQKISNYLVEKQQENFNQINEIAQEDKISVYQFKTSKSEGFKSLKNSFILEKQIDSIKKLKQTQSQKKPQFSNSQKFKKSKSSIDLSFSLENLQNQQLGKPQNQQFQEQIESSENFDPHKNYQSKNQTPTNELNDQNENKSLAKSENITQNIINVQNEQNQGNSSFFGKLSLGFKSTIQQVQSANTYVGESLYSQMDSIYSYVKSFSQLDQEIQRLQNQLGIEFYGQYFNQNQSEMKNLEQEKQAKQESFQGKQNRNSQTPKQVYKKMMEEFFNQSLQDNQEKHDQLTQMELKTQAKTEIKMQESKEVKNQSKSEQNLDNNQSCSLTKVETPKQRRKISFEIAEPSKYNSNKQKQEDQNQNKQQTTTITVKQISPQNKNLDKKNEKSQIDQKQEQKNDNFQAIQNPFKAVIKQQFFSLNQIENASQEQILLYISYLHIIIMINEQIGNETLLNCHMLSGLKDENLYIRNKNVFNLNAHQEKIFHLISENYTNLEKISYQVLLNFSFVLARFQNQTLLQINLQSQQSLQDSSGNENENPNLNYQKNLLSKKQQQLFKQLYAKSLELIVYLVGDYRNEKFLFNNFLPEFLKIEIDFFQVNFNDVSSTLFSLNQKNYPNIKKINNGNNNQQPIEKKKNSKKNSVEIQNQQDQNKDQQIMNEKTNIESQKQQNIEEIQNDKDQQNSKTVQFQEDENKKKTSITQENNKQQNQQQNNEKNIWLDFYNNQKNSDLNLVKIIENFIQIRKLRYLYIPDSEYTQEQQYNFIQKMIELYKCKFNFDKIQQISLGDIKISKNQIEQKDQKIDLSEQKLVEIEFQMNNISANQFQKQKLNRNLIKSLLNQQNQIKAEILIANNSLIFIQKNQENLQSQDLQQQIQKEESSNNSNDIFYGQIILNMNLLSIQIIEEQQELSYQKPENINLKQENSENENQNQNNKSSIENIENSENQKFQLNLQFNKQFELYLEKILDYTSKEDLNKFYNLEYNKNKLMSNFNTQKNNQHTKNFESLYSNNIFANNKNTHNLQLCINFESQQNLSYFKQKIKQIQKQAYSENLENIKEFIKNSSFDIQFI